MVMISLVYSSHTFVVQHFFFLHFSFSSFLSIFSQSPLFFPRWSLTVNTIPSKFNYCSNFLPLSLSPSLSVSVCLSLSLSVSYSLSLSLTVSLCLSQSLFVSVCLSVGLSVYRSVCLSVCQWVFIWIILKSSWPIVMKLSRMMYNNKGQIPFEDEMNRSGRTHTSQI